MKNNDDKSWSFFHASSFLLPPVSTKGLPRFSEIIELQNEKNLKNWQSLGKTFENAEFSAAAAATTAALHAVIANFCGGVDCVAAAAVSDYEEERKKRRWWWWYFTCAFHSPCSLVSPPQRTTSNCGPNYALMLSWLLSYSVDERRVVDRHRKPETMQLCIPAVSALWTSIEATGE